ncbi:MAG: hypothetical protein KKI08_05335 [Armatimonadetes bacterium]|nr:hypothetical protein [Armatimonadota bacterium]
MQQRAGSLADDLKRGVLPALASGVLCALLFYPYDLWFLAPVCLVPLLVALRRTGTHRAAAYLALLWGWAFDAVSLPWLWSIFSTGALGACVLITLPWAVFGLAYRYLSPRLRAPVLIALTPVLFTAVECVEADRRIARREGECSVGAVGRAYGT